MRLVDLLSGDMYTCRLVLTGPKTIIPLYIRQSQKILPPEHHRNIYFRIYASTASSVNRWDISKKKIIAASTSTPWIRSTGTNVQHFNLYAISEDCLLFIEFRSIHHILNKVIPPALKANCDLLIYLIGDNATMLMNLQWDHRLKWHLQLTETIKHPLNSKLYPART